MTASDRPGFAEAMLGLGEAYGEAISDARLEIYFAALADLSLEEVRRAATAHVRTRQFFPRVVELREGIQGSAEDRADLAWVELLRIVRRVGYWGEPTWADPTLQRAALELYGGWKSLCERLPAEGPELLGTAKLFKATYIAYARRATRDLPAFPTRDDARARLLRLRDELTARSLPAPGLPHGSD